MTPAPFTHHDEGTPESAWKSAFDDRMPSFAPLDAAFFETLDHLIVVAAHPDDETLGAAGLLARAGAAGARATVLVATSGERSHPDAAVDGRMLAGRREEETRAAVAAVDPGASVRFLRLPDGELATHRPALEVALTDAVGAGAVPGTVLVAPWAGDRHPDHAAASDAARTVAARAGLRVYEYPIWLWHWAAPHDPAVPWGDLTVLPLDDATRDRKAHAVALHRSQVLPLGDGPGEEALLHPAMLAHFARPLEAFVLVDTVAATGAATGAAAGAARAVRPAVAPTDVAPAALDDDGVATAYFDGLHERSDDPWGFESRWYEERKRAVLLASLPDRAYAAVLEVGSSTGVLSRELAARASGRLLGVDVSPIAVDRARERNADLPRATFERMHVPAEWPDGGFDLVVVSEVGYYLDPPDLTGLIERILGSLTPRGAVVLCHWRHPVAGRAADGDAVHAVFAERGEFARLARHLEEDFVLDVLVRAPGESVARREGIV